MKKIQIWSLKLRGSVHAKATFQRYIFNCKKKDEKSTCAHFTANFPTAKKCTLRQSPADKMFVVQLLSLGYLHCSCFNILDSKYFSERIAIICWTVFHQQPLDRLLLNKKIKKQGCLFIKKTFFKNIESWNTSFIISKFHFINSRFSYTRY